MVGLNFAPPDVPCPDPFDIDDWNEAAVRARADRDMDGLLAEAAAHRANMAAAIERMEDSHLDLIIQYGGDRKSLNLPKSQVRFGGLLWGIAIHDPTHTQDIVRALAHRARESWIVEWLGSVSDGLVSAGVREQRV